MVVRILLCYPPPHTHTPFSLLLPPPQLWNLGQTQIYTARKLRITWNALKFVNWMSIFPLIYIATPSKVQNTVGAQLSSSEMITEVQFFFLALRPENSPSFFKCVFFTSHVFCALEQSSQLDLCSLLPFRWPSTWEIHLSVLCCHIVVPPVIVTSWRIYRGTAQVVQQAFMLLGCDIATVNAVNWKK